MTTCRRIVWAPRGPALWCQGWLREATPRMLKNTYQTFAAAARRQGGDALTYSEAVAGLGDIRGVPLEVAPREFAPDVLTDRAPAHARTRGVRRGTSLARASSTRERQPTDYARRAITSMARRMDAIVINAFDIPGCVPEYVRPPSCEGKETVHRPRASQEIPKTVMWRTRWRSTCSRMMRRSSPRARFGLALEKLMRMNTIEAAAAKA